MIKIIGGNISGNGRNGISVGKGAEVEIIGVTTNNNGCHGVAFHSESDITLNNHTAVGNKFDGLYQTDQNLLDLFGLPESVDMDKLNELIVTLQQTPVSEREQVVYSSFLSGTLAILADSTTVVLNILDFTNQIPPVF